MTTQTFSTGALRIKPEHVFLAMGYKSSREVDEYTRQQTEALLNEAAGKLHPSACVETRNGTVEKGNLILGEQLFHPGETITGQLENASLFHVFIATVGKEFETWEKQEDDPLRSYIADAIGSCVAERCVTELHRRIRQQLPRNWGKTLHFSPGHCHWDVAEQQQLFNLFPASFNLVTLTDSFLMFPVKSVSGVIGTGENVTVKSTPCQLCLKKDCFRRLS